jgi:aromatic-L-amino-acid/L-tryptophan decarboxylase
MSPDEFRQRAHEVVDLLADYWTSIESRPVVPPTRPGDVLKALPLHPPAVGEPPEAVLDDLRRLILPNLTHWQSPNFFAYFPANSSFPAVLADLVSTGLGVQGMLWATSPACTELETRVLDWLGEMLDLPAPMRSTAGGGGVIHSTASDATLVALLAARARARAHASAQASTNGADDDRLVIYASNQTHSSFMKAAMIAGLARGPEDTRRVRLLPVHADYSLRADALERAMADDVDAGLRPAFVCATVGTTGTTAVDRLDELGPIARRHGAWLHVDAAFLGSAAVCPEYRWILSGVEHADSFCFNPHKWLLTSFDCSCFWTRDRASLLAALSINPDYLKNPASAAGDVIDYRDWQIPLGRRFRALKLWFVLRHYGVQGLQAHIREHTRLGELFESFITSDDRFELAAPRVSSLVCFRLKGPDDANRTLMDRLNASGKLYLTHTVLPTFGGSGEVQGRRLVLRMAIGATLTQERHVRAAWDQIRAEAGRVRA